MCITILLIVFSFCFTAEVNVISIFGETNHYLIPLKGEDTGYLLIDTPREAVFDIFYQNLEDRGIRLDEIKCIFVTHHHHDHAGTIKRIVDRTDNVKVIVSERSKEFLSAGNGLDDDYVIVNFWVRLIRMWAEYQQGVHDYAITPYEFRNEDLIVRYNEDSHHEKDDENYSDKLREIGIDGKIIRTPGHSIDSISLVLESGETFVGDAAMNFPTYDWLFRWKKHPIIYSELDEVHKSWNLLKESGAKTIFPGHGDIFDVSDYNEFLSKFDSKQEEL